MRPFRIGPAIHFVLLQTHRGAHLQDVATVVPLYNSTVVLRVIGPAFQNPPEINGRIHNLPDHKPALAQMLLRPSRTAIQIGRSSKGTKGTPLPWGRGEGEHKAAAD